MEQNNRILVVDDNASIHRDFNKVLCNQRNADKKRLRQIERGLFQDESEEEQVFAQPQYTVDSAYQGEEALEMVRTAASEGRPYAMIFMDVRMPPGWDGIETIGYIWAEFPDIEMVICTAYSDYSWERIMVQLGTTDRLLFLRKPFDTTAVKQMALSQTQKWNLGKQAEHYVAKLRSEIETRRESEEKLQYLAHHDPLTGLANRTRFNHVLVDAIREIDDRAERLALLFVDLDRFKEINDTLGYHNGDALLKQVAERLARVIGETGIVARFGGDEFAVLIHDVASLERAHEIAANIHREIEPPFTIEDLLLEVTASVGIVIYPEHGTEADTLMRRADITMSVAKKTDQGLTVYEDRFDHFSPRRLTLLGELRQAITRDDLSLHFQPKISIETGLMTGAEALVRWFHPKHGPIFPDEFIPLAERSGLIKPLSMWVLEQAPRQWARWKAEGIDISISVNLSVRDLFDIYLHEKLKGFLEEAAMPADRLVLEITESAMMEDPDQARATLFHLSDMGIKLSIDDFGTGYSSLAYLKNLPVDEIKIDRSFVFDMDKDPDDAIIVKSTVDLGHTLGLGVVAEGVEQERHWELLRELECDYAQGYYMSRPVSAEDLTGWMKTSRWGLGAEQKN